MLFYIDAMEENKPCFSFREFNYDDGFFKDSIDATYIIHLEGNGRYNHIISQLIEYHTTNKIYIVMNKGYKKCKKRLHYQKPAYDLTDAFLQIFKDAKKEEYENILILEDDFIFRPTIKEYRVYSDINSFLNHKKNDSFVYYIGCIPYIQSMGYGNHNRLLLSTGTHACIYSKKLREHVLKRHKQNTIIDWDILHNVNYFFYNRYVYYQPLCYQLITPTENYNEWANPFGMADIIKSIFHFLELDKRVEPGHTFFYVLSKIIFGLICFFGLILFILLYQVVQKRAKIIPIIRRFCR